MKHHVENNYLLLPREELSKLQKTLGNLRQETHVDIKLDASLSDYLKDVGHKTARNLSFILVNKGLCIASEFALKRLASAIAPGSSWLSKTAGFAGRHLGDHAIKRLARSVPWFKENLPEAAYEMLVAAPSTYEFIAQIPKLVKDGYSVLSKLPTMSYEETAYFLQESSKELFAFANTSLLIGYADKARNRLRSFTKQRSQPPTQPAQPKPRTTTKSKHIDFEDIVKENQKHAQQQRKTTYTYQKTADGRSIKVKTTQPTCTADIPDKGTNNPSHVESSTVKRNLGGSSQSQSISRSGQAGSFGNSDVPNAITSVSKNTIKKVTRRQAQRLADSVNGRISKTIKTAAGKTKGYIIEYGNKNNPNTIRLMNAGSGKRNYAYYRVTKSGKGALDKEGNFCENQSKTHFNINPNTFIEAIKSIINKSKE